MAILPNENLKKSDVRDLLNQEGGAADNVFGSLFQESSKINPFSKHKPVRLSKNFCQDIDSAKSDYDEDWWTGEDGNCGLIPFSVSSYTNIPENLDGGMNGWVYQLPNGSSTSPYRIGDFRSYKSDALPMLHSFMIPSQVTNSGTQNSIIGTCAAQVQDYYNLSFADFPTFKNYYFGMYIRQKNGTRYAYKTSESTLGDGGYEAIISAYGLPEGTWEAYPFISNVLLDGVTSKVADYYTIPMTQKMEFEIVSTLLVINITAYYNYINGVKRSVSIESIKITNRTGSGLTFTNNTLQLRYLGDSLTDDPAKSSTIDTFDVGNGEEYSIPLKASQSLQTLPDTSKSYYIRVTLNASQYTANGQIAEEITTLTRRMI